MGGVDGQFPRNVLIMILESQPTWQAFPHEFVGKVGTRAKEWNEGGRGRVREGNKGLTSDRDISSLKFSFLQSLF